MLNAVFYLCGSGFFATVLSYPHREHIPKDRDWFVMCASETPMEWPPFFIHSFQRKSHEIKCFLIIFKSENFWIPWLFWKCISTCIKLHQRCRLLDGKFEVPNSFCSGFCLVSLGGFSWGDFLPWVIFHRPIFKIPLQTSRNTEQKEIFSCVCTCIQTWFCCVYF